MLLSTFVFNDDLTMILTLQYVKLKDEETTKKHRLSNMQNKALKTLCSAHLKATNLQFFYRTFSSTSSATLKD